MKLTSRARANNSNSTLRSSGFSSRSRLPVSQLHRKTKKFTSSGVSLNTSSPRRTTLLSLKPASLTSSFKASSSSSLRLRSTLALRSPRMLDSWNLLAKTSSARVTRRNPRKRTIKSTANSTSTTAFRCPHQTLSTTWTQQLSAQRRRAKRARRSNLRIQQVAKARRAYQLGPSSSKRIELPCQANKMRKCSEKR